MDLSIALDGSRRRNIQLFAGDEPTINVIVYAKDGDTDPIAVENLTFVTAPDGESFIPVGSVFTVPDSYPMRSSFRITGEIGDATTTLLYGILEIEGGHAQCNGGDDYGMGCGSGPLGGWGEILVPTP